MSPIYASIGAIVLLREPSRLVRWLSIAIGFAGMLVIIRPGFGVMNAGVALVIAATVIGATGRLMTKSLTRTDTAATIVVYMSATVTVATFIPALFVWSWPTPTQWLWFVVIGAMGSAGHWLATRALKLGDVTVIEPVTYVRLIWAGFFGFAVFGDFPAWQTWLGGIVIILGAVLLLRVETRDKPRIPSAA
jgi:drug/metabolite transporter (DMT)-like permease